MAKELSIRSDERIFVVDAKDFNDIGEKAAHRALEEMGGYPGLIAKLPFDRGDTNQALVTLCLKIAAAVEASKPALASSLRAEALKLRDAERGAGVRGEPLEVSSLLEQINSLWKELDEQNRDTIKSTPGMTGDLGEIIDAQSSAGVRVLSVTCDPSKNRDRLHLEVEQRAIQQAIALAPHGAKIKIEYLFAATTDDLRRKLLSREYDIVHFSGHANKDVLLFADSEHKPLPVPISAVADLIGRYPSVKCVVLNACESVKALTVAISPRTIGMEEQIPDAAATKFSTGFYDALGSGYDIDLAFEEGVSAMKLASFDTSYVRLLR